MISGSGDKSSSRTEPLEPIEADSKRRRKRMASFAAALTSAIVMLFAATFIGAVVILNNYADSLQAESTPRFTLSANSLTEPFYVLLIGSDSRKGTAIYNAKGSGSSKESQYADVITLMRVDPRDYKITLVSVPRDTVLDGQTSKINAALNSDDPRDVVDAVEKLAGVQVDSYLMTTFISFENLINALGGINIDVPKTVKLIDPATGKNVTVKKGKNQHLNGSQALVLARAREEYDGNTEALRQVNVRGIERAMIEAVLNMDGNIDVERVLTALSDDTRSDIDVMAYSRLILDFVEHANDVTIYDGTGTYEGGERSGDKAWVIPEDDQAWEALMAAVNAGEDPQSVIKPPAFK